MDSLGFPFSASSLSEQPKYARDIFLVGVLEKVQVSTNLTP